MSFEGSEKKVEVIFKAGLPSLRQREAFWLRVVQKSKAEVLNKISGRRCDAYLLSESSLFVYDDQMVMITCGRTSLIHAVEEILAEFSADHVELLVYERKNEVFPELQSSTFEDDVARLEQLIPGKTFYFGEKGGNQIKLFHLEKDFKPALKDLTLEVLMHGLDPAIQPLFSSHKNSVKQLRTDTGICDILPGFLVDDYLFEPQGYSVNAIKSHAYYTSHVTPEPECSYASFETNLFLQDDVNRVIMDVVEIFKPREFAVVLFEPTATSRNLDLSWQPRVEEVVELDCGYRFHFYDFYNESR